MWLSAVDVGPPSGMVRNLRTDVWEKTQVRLAHLLPPRDMKNLALYYELLRVAQHSNIRFIDDVESVDDLSRDEQDQIEKLVQLGGRLSQSFQKYIQDPDYKDLLESIARQRGE